MFLISQIIPFYVVSSFSNFSSYCLLFLENIFTSFNFCIIFKWFISYSEQVLQFPPFICLCNSGAPGQEPAPRIFWKKTTRNIKGVEHVVYYSRSRGAQMAASQICKCCCSPRASNVFHIEAVRVVISLREQLSVLLGYKSWLQKQMTSIGIAKQLKD